MATRTGVLSSATPALDLYNLIAADLTANPNWSRPVDPTLTGATDSYNATSTSQVWKCTVGSNSFHMVFSTDTASPNLLRLTLAEKYGAADGCAAKRFRRIPAGGGTSSTGDNTSVTPGATDVVTDTDSALPQSTPNFARANLTLSGGAFSYLFKVTNKTVTIGAVVSGANLWWHGGAFESLVTGPSDPMPIGMFGHPVNSPVVSGGTQSTTTHYDGVVTRNPGLGTTAESGAFFAQLRPLHAPGAGLIPSVTETTQAASVLGFGASPPRWYTKVLVSQAVIHQSRAAGATQGQAFRGYYSDLFACVIKGTTEPQGGGVDSVVIDGVTYYWLGANCTGTALAGITDGVSVLVAVRAD